MLSASTRRFVLQPRRCHGSFFSGTLDNFVRDAFDLGRNRAEESSSSFSARAAVAREGIRCQAYGKLDFFRGRGNEWRLEMAACGGIGRVERISGTMALAETDQRATGEIRFVLNIPFTFGLVRHNSLQSEALSAKRHISLFSPLRALLLRAPDEVDERVQSPSRLPVEPV